MPLPNWNFGIKIDETAVKGKDPMDTFMGFFKST